MQRWQGCPNSHKTQQLFVHTAHRWWPDPHLRWLRQVSSARFCAQELLMSCDWCGTERLTAFVSYMDHEFGKVMLLKTGSGLHWKHFHWSVTPLWLQTNTLLIVSLSGVYFITQKLVGEKKRNSLTWIVTEMKFKTLLYAAFFSLR